MNTEVIKTEKNLIDEFMFLANRCKKHNITPQKYLPKEFLKEGGEFFYFDVEFNCVRLIKITHIRSGVCFYTIEDEEHLNEYWFPIDSFFSIMLESKKYITNMDSRYYNVISRLGMSEIEYVVDDKEESWIKPFN